MMERERALIVGLHIDSREDIDASMEELAALVEASDAEVVSTIVQAKDKVDAATFIGKGKAEEIKNYVEELDIDMVVFNDELSGSQIRNLEKLIGRKIVDRTNLILDIFAQRATTSEGKLQVKLAQLEYRLPRLVGFKDYLSRTGGGIGTRGPGEQQIETDRRHILRERDNIKRKLKEASAIRETTRKKRGESELPIISLVGYTNSGKSTLLNRMLEYTDAEEDKYMFTKDMLFATLDTSLRKSKLLNGNEILVTDTVGFVSKLPTKLIEAFKGTLEEIQFSDVILHVIDVSNENLELQRSATNSVLEDLKVLDKPIIYVFNKVDQVDLQEVYYNFEHTEPKIFMSAKVDENIDPLMKLIEEVLSEDNVKVIMCFGYDEQNVLNDLRAKYAIGEVEYTDEGAIIELSLDQRDYERYKKYVKQVV